MFFAKKNIVTNWRDQMFLRKKYCSKLARPEVFAKKISLQTSETSCFLQKILLQ
jgi:hypothetical protein